jgi:hypothetical protein
MDSPENNLISLQTHKEITNLYKTFLEILEDIRINQSTITPEFYEQLRKRILDKGNSTERSLLSFLEYFDFQINTQKLQEAATKQKVIKKIVIQSPLL